jgi:hypothetical protein
MEWNGLQVARFDRGARRVTGIRQAGVMSSLAGELQLGLDVPFEPYDRAAFGLADFGSLELAAPVGANQSGACIVNSNPDTIAHVSFQHGAFPVGGIRVFLTLGNPLAGVLFFCRYRDPRIVGPGIGGTFSGGGLIPPGGEVYSQVTQPPFQGAIGPFILPFGAGLLVLAATIATALTVYFTGSIRYADSSELQQIGI